ncbi:hypothetical protein TMEN_5302 [Trichophyton mentagrophytes]|nr:hypothetical protein TMEN_5302 [Trichophyton mentagrophytes]
MVPQQMGSPDEGLQRRRSAPGFGSKAQRGSRGSYGYRSKKGGPGHGSFHPMNAPFPQDQPPPSCYTCGSYDHMVQHCPEYQHETSPGFHKHPRPAKRQRTAEGSRHQYRDEFPPSQRGPPHRSFSHGSHSYNYYDYPGPASPEQEEWHHRPPYGYPPYEPHGPPPMAGYDYDSHGPMPPYHYNDAPPPGYHSRRPPRRRESDYPEYPMEGPPPSWDAPPRGSHSWRGKGRKGRDGHTSTRRPDSHVEGFYDLDTTDSAQNSWRSPHAVGRPLPSVFSDLDDICKLPPHTSLPPGMSVSKYFLNKGADEFNENIRNTEDWPFMMGDPIFSEFPSDGETVPVKDLINRQKDMMAAHKYVPPKPVVEETSYDSEQADEPEIPDDASYAGSEEQGQANGAESPEENGSYTASEQGRDHDREYKRHQSQARNTEDNTNTPMSTTPGNNDSDERPQTPQRYSKPQSFHGSYHRKRAREESLELPDDEIQRQVDDVAPRLERRHPRVAEAYSRRW